jgi:hypothetical protein
MSINRLYAAAAALLLSAGCADVSAHDALGTREQPLRKRPGHHHCPPPPPPAPTCLFGSTFYELRTEGALTIESESWIRALSDVEGVLQGEQVVVAVQQSSHTDVTTPEEALSRVDQNEVRHMLLLDPASARRYELFEYGAGDNSYGAIFRAGTLEKVASIHDGDLLECTETGL